MPIPVHCAACQATSTARDTAAGRRVTCPKCGAALTVPLLPPAAPSSVAASGETTRTARNGPSEEGLNTLVSRFERNWLGGVRVPVEAFVAGAADRTTALLELVHSELELRLKAGEPARVEEYLGRFSELSDPAALESLVHAEFRFRRRADPAVAWAEFRGRFPGVPEPTVSIPTGRPAAHRPVPVAPDGYELLAELGRGGMGVVYKARQVQAGRDVALKLILTGDAAGGEEVRRFRAEAVAAAALQHPNIAQVYEVGEHRAQPFFSMEFCAGGTLAKRLAGTPLPAADAARLVRDLAAAMSAAHGAGIVHRDLKPANVLLGADGTPKVADFGLAKRLGEADGLTRTGAVMGTPSYMPPEQASGDTKRVGPAADTYALGAILYECLTGRPPFKGATLLDTLDQVRNRPPVPPGQLNPAVPRDLETVCLKCLEKEPAKRYESAAALAADLKRFLTGRPVSARRAGRAERAWKWVKRNPVPSAAAAVIAAVVVVAFGLIFSAYRSELRSNTDKDIALQGERNANAAKDVALQGETAAKSAAQSEAARALEAKGQAETEAKISATANYAGLIERAQQEIANGNYPLAQRLLLRCRPDLRGWEWDYAWQQATDRRGGIWLSQPSAIDPRVGAVQFSEVAVAPDGAEVYVGTAGIGPRAKEGEVRCLDPRTGREVRVVARQAAQIAQIAVDPKGRWLATVAVAPTSDGVPEQGTGRLWSVTDGKQVRELPDEWHVERIAFNATGTKLAVGCRDGSVRVVDPETGKETATFTGHRPNAIPSGRLILPIYRTILHQMKPAEATAKASGWDLAFDGSGRRVASFYGRNLRVWDCDTGKEVDGFRPFTLNGSTDIRAVVGLRFSQDDQRLLGVAPELMSDNTSGSGPHGQWRAWSAATGEHLEMVSGFGRSAAADPTGRVWVGLASGRLKVWDAVARQSRMVGGSSEMFGLQGIPGDTFAVLPGGTHAVWIDETGVAISELGPPPLRAVGPDAFSQEARGTLTEDGQRIVSVEEPTFAGFQDGKPTFKGEAALIRVWSVEDRRLLAEIPLGAPLVERWYNPRQSSGILGSALATGWYGATPDGHRVAAYLPAKRAILVWDTDTKAVVSNTPLPPDLAWPGGKPKTISFPGPDGKPQEKLAESYPNPVRALSPDARLVVLTDNRNRVGVAQTPGSEPARLLELGTGKVRLTLPSARAACFSPDGRRLLTINEGWQLWDLTPDTPRRVAEGSRSVAVFGSSMPNAFGAGGVFAVVASRGADDETVEVRDAESGSLRFRVRFQDGPRSGGSGPTRVGFTPDGRRLVVLAGRKLLLWDVATGQQVHQSPAPGGALWEGLRFTSDRALILIDDQQFDPLTAFRTQFAPKPYRHAVGGGNLGPPLIGVGDGTGGGTAVVTADGRRMLEINGNPGRDGQAAQSVVRLWDTATGRPIGADATTIPGTVGHYVGVALRPDGREVAIPLIVQPGKPGQLGSGRSAVQLLDTETGQSGPVYERDGDIHAVCWSSDGRVIALVVVGADGARLEGLVRATGKDAFTPIPLPAGEYRTCRMAFLPTRPSVVAVGNRTYLHGTMSLRLLDTTNGKEVTSFPLPAHTYLGPHAVGPDGRTLAAGINDAQSGGRVCVWDANTGRLILMFTVGRHSSFAPVATFLRGGSVIAVDGAGFFDAATGRELSADDLTPAGRGLLGPSGWSFGWVRADGDRIAVQRTTPAGNGGGIQTWETDQLFARKAAAVDLAPKPEFDPAAKPPDLEDRFKSVDSSPFGDSAKKGKDGLFTMTDGRYRMRIPAGWAGWVPYHRDGEIAVRVTATLTGGAADGWMLRVHGKDPKDNFGVFVGGAGQIELVRLPDGDAGARTPRLPAVNLRSVRPAGEPNTVVVAFRDGKMELAVNGVRVADPIPLPASVRDLWLGLGIAAAPGSKDIQVEFAEFCVWDLGTKK